MIKKIGFLLIVAALCFTTNVFAQAEYILLSDLGTSAKTIGIGNIAGFDNSSNAIFENPANLGSIQKTSVSMYTTTLIDEFEITALSISQKTRWGTFGIGQLRGAVSDIPKTSVRNDNDPNQRRFIKIGSFDYTDTLSKISYENRLLYNVHFGLSLNNYSKKLDTISASATDMDFGLKYLGKKLELSAFARNILGSTVNFSNNESEILPTQIIGAFKLDILGINLLGQTKINGKKGIQNAFGAMVPFPFFNYLKLMGGYQEYFVLNTKKSGLTLGLSLDIGGLHFQYAYEKSDHIEFDNKNYFSLSLNFNIASMLNTEKNKKRLR